MRDQRAETQAAVDVDDPPERVDPIDRDDRLGQRGLALPGADHEIAVTIGVTKDRKSLVTLAGRVNETIETRNLPATKASSVGQVEDREARELVDKARTKVIPFLDDAQAQTVQQLVEAVESAVNGQIDGAKRALDAELRKYSYLF